MQWYPAQNTRKEEKDLSIVEATHAPLPLLLFLPSMAGVRVPPLLATERETGIIKT